MEDVCRAAGLSSHKHYIQSSELNEIDPSIDISGTCNLRCVSCPRGNLEDPDPIGFMSLEDYRLVLGKLLREIPFLGSIQFYAWGEPLLNRQLPEMIGLTREYGVLTAISTNLKVNRGLNKVIAARPDWLKVSASGFGQNYEIAHTGGNWERFQANLYELAELRDRLHPDMQVTLNYHLYKHNTGESYLQMQALCEQLHFLFRPNMAYLYSLDNVLDYVEGRAISPAAQQTLGMMLLDINDGLAKCQTRKHLPCPEERCLPITWDRRVRFCGVYFNRYIADDFMTVSTEEILALRHNSDFCQRCMSHGLHQYTGVYLEERFLAGEVAPLPSGDRA